MSKSYTKYGEKEKTYYYFIHLQLLPVICRKKQKTTYSLHNWIVLKHLSLWEQSAA